jgi:hypothetical protein
MHPPSSDVRSRPPIGAADVRADVGKPRFQSSWRGEIVTEEKALALAREGRGKRRTLRSLGRATRKHTLLRSGCPPGCLPEGTRHSGGLKGGKALVADGRTGERSPLSYSEAALERKPERQWPYVFAAPQPAIWNARFQRRVVSPGRCFPWRTICFKGPGTSGSRPTERFDCPGKQRLSTWPSSSMNTRNDWSGRRAHSKKKLP